MTKEEALARIRAYRNPDPRCTYPFTPNPLGYCWSYANHVDGTKGLEDFEDMVKICKTCELWKEPAHEPQSF